LLPEEIRAARHVHMKGPGWWPPPAFADRERHAAPGGTQQPVHFASHSRMAQSDCDPPGLFLLRKDYPLRAKDRRVPSSGSTALLRHHPGKLGFHFAGKSHGAHLATRPWPLALLTPAAESGCARLRISITTAASLAGSCLAKSERSMRSPSTTVKPRASSASRSAFTGCAPSLR